MSENTFSYCRFHIFIDSIVSLNRALLYDCNTKQSAGGTRGGELWWFSWFTSLHLELTGYKSCRTLYLSFMKMHIYSKALCYTLQSIPYLKWEKTIYCHSVASTCALAMIINWIQYLSLEDMIFTFHPVLNRTMNIFEILLNWTFYTWNDSRQPLGYFNIYWAKSLLYYHYCVAAWGNSLELDCIEF